MNEQSEQRTESPAFELVPQSAVEAINRAEVDLQISTAKRYPRDLVQVKKDMASMACLDPETAEGCFYNLPRGGKNIQGPSIRLAEIAISCFGNLRVASRIISTETSGAHPNVVIQAGVLDLQKNVCVTIEKRRRILPKKNREGGYQAVSDDDVNLAVNSCTAIALRDATFKVVPLALVKPIYEQAKRVAIGDAKGLSDRRVACFEKFAKMGVAKERVLAFLEKQSEDSVDLGDIEKLLGVFSALRDGENEIQIDDIFPKIDSKSKFTPRHAGKQDDHPPGLEPKQEAKSTPSAATTKPEPAREEKKPDAPLVEPKSEKPADQPAQTAPQQAPATAQSPGAIRVEVQPDDVPTVLKFASESGVAESQICKWATTKWSMAVPFTELKSMPSKKVAFIRAQWFNIMADMAKLPKE